MINRLFLTKHSPRWLVLLVDISISFVSILSAHYLRNNFEIPQELDPLLFSVPFVVGVRFLSFVFTRTYAGIVRYTSTKDAERIFVVLLMGSVFFSLSNIVSYYYINDTYILPFSVIVIDFFINAFLMTASRFIVKAIFSRFQDASKSKKQVIIYGADIYGIKTKKTLEKDSQTIFEVVAFIDDNSGNVGKKLDGVSIYTTDKLEEIFRKKTVSMFIFAKLGTDPDLKNQIIDLCLNYYVKVSTVPDFNDWINGELNFNQIRDIKIEDLLERPPIQLDEKQIGEEIFDNCIMVTGAAGSIGSEIVRQATRFHPRKIILFDQAESPLYDIELELKEKLDFHDFEIIIGDITNKVRVNEIFEQYKPRIVYHAAAYKHVPMMERNPVEAVHNNIMGTRIIADAAIEHRVRKFVMVSTDKAVNPTNVMGASKRIAEIYIQTRNQSTATSFITTRFGNVLGSNGSVIPRFKKQIEQGGPITVTHAKITRYFMTIPEACQLVLEAGAMGKGGEIFIFDMGKSVKIVDLAKKMIRLSGLTVGQDIEIKFTGLRPGEKLYEELLADKENTMPTHHSQIMVAKVREYNSDVIIKKIDRLIEMRISENAFELVKTMKTIVPEFKSKNSEYEELDSMIVFDEGILLETAKN